MNMLPWNTVKPSHLISLSKKGINVGQYIRCLTDTWGLQKYFFFKRKFWKQNTKCSLPSSDFFICIIFSKSFYTKYRLVIKLIIFNAFNQLFFSICSSYPINCNSMAACSNFIMSTGSISFKIKISRLLCYMWVKVKQQHWEKCIKLASYRFI